MDRHQKIQIKIWFELQLHITEMSQSHHLKELRTPPSNHNPNPRFTTPSQLNNSTPHPIEPASPSLIPSPNGLHMKHVISKIKENPSSIQKNTSFGFSNMMSKWVDKAMRKCTRISFKLFKIVDIIGTGGVEVTGRLAMGSSNEILIAKDNKILNYQVDAHEFKNEFDMADIYYEKKADLGKNSLEYVSTGSGKSREFFSTTQDCTGGKEKSQINPRTPLATVSCFQTPVKSSKKMSKFSNKILAFSTPEKSLKNKYRPKACAIPKLMKIDCLKLLCFDSPQQIGLQKSSAKIVQKKIQKTKSMMGSAAKRLFDEESQLAESETSSHFSQDLSFLSSETDTLSFILTRRTPFRQVLPQNTPSQVPAFQDKSRSYSWFSLFNKNINKFEKSANPRFLWILDNENELFVLRDNKVLALPVSLRETSITVCKWVAPQVLVIANLCGGLFFVRIEEDGVRLLEKWTVSKEPIQRIQSNAPGTRMVCEDSSRRLFAYDLKRVLLLPDPSRPFTMINSPLFRHVSQSAFHPRRDNVLIILKTIPRNEIIFLNLSTQTVISRRYFPWNLHCFCYHESEDMLFLSASRKSEHFISIFQISSDFKQFFFRSNFEKNRSKSKFLNLQVRSNLLVSTTDQEKMFIWKTNDLDDRINKDIKMNLNLERRSLLR